MKLLNKGDLVNYEGETFIILDVIGPNLFGQIKYELKLFSEFWAEYLDHGNGD